MKKKLSLIVALLLVMSLFAGCKSNLPKDNKPADEGTTPTEQPADNDGNQQPAAEGSLKTGLAVITGTGSSKDAGDEDGLGQVDSTIVALTLDQDGKIVSCVIDNAQTKMKFSKEGKLVTDINTTFKTKKELGAEYGMAKASSIGKEWNEQADAFAAFVVGKTVDEVKGIAVTEEGAPSDTDLAASVTVSVGGFISGIEKAAANAQDLGAQAGDKLGLGVSTNMSKSKEAADGNDGLVQAYSTYTALTVGADGKITSCIIDASQGGINFDGTGKITSDLAAAVQTKNELGDAYGMKSQSSIGKEWNEEAAAYAQYVTGKTLEEVKGIAVTEEGAPSDADLAASVTIGIGEFNTIIEKAVSTAK